MAENNFPKLHNAAWPGLVGKGSPGAEPFIDLDTMLDMTAKAEVGGVKFDGIDLFLYNPHTDIDISEIPINLDGSIGVNVPLSASLTGPITVRRDLPAAFNADFTRFHLALAEAHPAIYAQIERGGGAGFAIVTHDQYEPLIQLRRDEAAERRRRG